MALACAEPRLAPLGNTFQVWDARPRDRRRSHSHSGYTPHHLRMLRDGLETGSEPRAAAAPCASEASDDSTSAPGSRVSEAPSSPRGSTPDLWPDTDSDDEEAYEWSPCSRSGRGLAPAPARVQAGGEGWPRHAARGASPPQVLATTPTGGAACLPATAVPSAQVFLPPAATPLPLCGHIGQAGAPPGAAPPLGAVGQPLAQVPAPPWLAVLTPAPAVPTLQGPGWFGGQPPMPMVSPAARAAWLLPPWRLPEEAAAAVHGQSSDMMAADSALAAAEAEAGSLESAMLAAESALAALEAAEEEAAREAAAAGSEGEAAKATPRTPKPLPAGVTSLMLRSLPREVTQRRLLDDVSRSGFAGKVDFCYMPRDFASGENLGHAFLNFTSSAAAAEFHQAWLCRPCCAGHPAGESGIDVSVAALQGLAANAAKWDSHRMRRVRNPDFKPFVLEGGAASCPCGKSAPAIRAV